MNPRILKLAGSLCVSLAALAGCEHHQLEPVSPKVDPYAAQHIYLDSLELRNDVAFDTVVRSRDEAGILHIVAPLRSIVDKQLHVQYRVRFFDRNGSLVNEIGWTDKTLTAFTRDTVEANSTGPKAEEFEVHLRYPPGY